MNSQTDRLGAVMSAIVPVDIVGVRAETKLVDLGFDSLSLIALFIDLQREFALSLDAIRMHLSMACTLGSLLTLCSAPTI